MNNVNHKIIFLIIILFSNILYSNELYFQNIKKIRENKGSKYSLHVISKRFNYEVNRKNIDCTIIKKLKDEILMDLTLVRNFKVGKQYLDYLITMREGIKTKCHLNLGLPQLTKIKFISKYFKYDFLKKPGDIQLIFFRIFYKNFHNLGLNKKFKKKFIKKIERLISVRNEPKDIHMLKIIELANF